MSTPTGELGARTLDWLLTRLKKQKLVATDLVIVRDRPDLLANAPAVFQHGGLQWRFARVQGPLGLREALPDQDRAVIAVPETLDLPRDVAGRSHLHRKVEIRARDVVAAMAGRFCDSLDDDGLEQAVWELLPDLQRRAGRWTIGPAVLAADVRSMVLSALLGRQGLLDSEGRIDREDPGELLGRWIARPPTQVRAGAILQRALEEAHGLDGQWLGPALVGGWLPSLVAGGALVDSDVGRSALPSKVDSLLGALADGHGAEAAQRSLSRLARGAARWLATHDSSALSEALGPAEAAWQRLRESGQDFPLLRGALQVSLHDLARAGAQGEPPDDAQVLRLERNVWAPLHRGDIETVRTLARLARFVRAVPVDPPRTPAQWASVGLRDTGWADRLARDLRRALPAASGDLRRFGQAVLDGYLAHRDALNARFAATVRDQWTAMAATRGADQVMGLHQLSRELLAPLLRHVDHLFLVVLDGCDVSSFVELALGLPPDLGLALPAIEDGDAFSDLLVQQPALRAAWSLPPTVTAHARRGLFAGEIPGNAALDDAELTAADATSDHRAFDRNQALAGLDKTLFLKGELRDGGTALRQVLKEHRHRLVAAVYNGIDDALASHETTALGPWRPDALGEGFLDALRTAVDHGWTVVLTSDHGHTPHWSQDRKLAGGAKGQRFKQAVDSDGMPGVVLDGDAVPDGPVLCLHRVGAFFGQQRRGYHGGVGLEELVVPLAFLGKVRDGSGRPAPPSWWSTTDGERVEDTRVRALKPQRAPEREDALERYRRVVAGDQRALDMVGQLARHRRLSLEQLAAVTGMRPQRVRGFVGKLNQRFRDAQLGEPLVLEGDGADASVAWEGPLVQA